MLGLGGEKYKLEVADYLMPTGTVVEWPVGFLTDEPDGTVTIFVDHVEDVM